MQRRQFLEWTAATAGMITSGCGTLSNTHRNQPNFVVIFTDDQGYGDLGCNGSTGCSTPRIDAMAAEGMRFTDFYVTAAICTPSRASLMTGCYPMRVSLSRVLFPSTMEDGQVDGKPAGLNPNEITIAEILKDVGYRTACIGKWHLGDRKAFLPTRHGFDEFFGLPYSNDMIPSRKHNGQAYDSLPMYRDEEIIELNPDQDFLTKRYTEEAIQFIRRNRDNPFFLYLPHSMPHRPIHASPKFREKVKDITADDVGHLPIYCAALNELDWSTGQILDTLEELGLTDNTLVIYATDNGPAEGSSGPLRGRKTQFYEGGFRVPCIALWPGHIPAGAECHEIATSMDILPTFSRLAGGHVPDDRIIDGKDIWPLLSGEPGATSPHNAFYYYWAEALMCVRSGKWKYVARYPVAMSNEAGWGWGPDALYDLENDLGETTNVIEQHPDVADHMRQLMAVMREDLGDLATNVTGKNCRPCGTIPLT